MASDSTSVWVSVISGATGGAIALLGTLVNQWSKERAERKLEEPRRKLLREMLEDERHEWRRLETLMHVIGGDEATTKRLLLEIGGRGSEDGQNLWGLVRRHPFRGPVSITNRDPDV